MVQLYIAVKTKKPRFCVVNGALNSCMLFFMLQGETGGRGFLELFRSLGSGESRAGVMVRHRTRAGDENCGEG